MKLSLTMLAPALTVLVFLVTSSYHNLPEEDPAAGIEPPFLHEGKEWVDSVYESLTRDERIAQLFMVRAYSNRGNEHRENVLRLIEKYNIGGICFFQGGPVRQANLTNLYQATAKTPLLVALDAEWGPGMRLDSTLSYPRQMTLGAIDDDELIYYMGRDIASQLRLLGVHMNLAPVLDINSNPANPVIGSRSFGEEAGNVSRKGLAYIRGLQDGGMLCTAKHFPGHGDTDTDSHHTLPLIMHGRDRLMSVETLPFRHAIRQGVSGVMTAHLQIPALDSTPGLASSLSENIVTGLLKKEMGYRGLVVTDALDMRGASAKRRAGETEALAFAAGNDILLIPSDIGKAITAIKREIRKGSLSWGRVEESCKKILKAKYWAGLHSMEPVETAGLVKKLNFEPFRANLASLVKSSITLLKNRDGLVPLRELDTLKIASVWFGDKTKNEFQEQIDLYLPSAHFYISGDAPAKEYLDLLEKLGSYNLVITGVHNSGISENTVLFINQLTRERATIVAVFDSPYRLGQFDFGNEMKALLLGYQVHPVAQSAAIQIIFGGLPAKGNLPVTSSAKYNSGTGIHTRDAGRLTYGIPEEAGMDSRQLCLIDTICLNAIKEKAMPGCQVLAARNGMVFYHKAFGYHTYARRDKVDLSDLYDLASVTKIVATLPVLMRLTQQGIFDLGAKLSTYLPELDTCDKGELIIQDILSHHARLTPWIPFYYETLEPMDADDSLLSNKYSSRYPIRLAGHVYLNKNLNYVDQVYAEEPSDRFSVMVAENLYMNRDYLDSLYMRMVTSKLLEKEEYRYSDLGYYFLYRFVTEMTDTTLDDYVSDHFYDPLGAQSTGYLPLKRFPAERIVPTENDIFFRRQLLRGYVHDPGAAMMGGVAGHAGVFSNANDLAKIMQMYLNGGSYGGMEYIADSIIDMYNTCIHCQDGNRRGIGFDKPEMDDEKEGPTCRCVSPSSFGHTGFTGTMAWADPESGIIYIFLSNKVHPDQDNTRLVDMDVRTRIQEVINKAILF